MAFVPVVMRKQGKTDRIARTPTELVQFEYEGWVNVREASKKVAAAVTSESLEKAQKKQDQPAE